MGKFRVVEAFSGIGSQAKAIKKAGLGHWEIINTIEWDINSILAYFFIHHDISSVSKYDEMDEDEIDGIICKFDLSMDGKSLASKERRKALPIETKKRLAAAIESSNNLGSITQIKGEELEDDIDLLTYSFPCQDLSIAGVWHGLNTGINRNIRNRSGMLWEVERILNDRDEDNLKLPKFLLMENVRNILSKKHIGDFESWKDTLKRLGYVNQHYKLNAKDFGIPQNRERVFMLSVYVGKNVELYKQVENLLNNAFLNISTGEAPAYPQSIENYLRTDYSNPVYKNESDDSQPNETPSRTKIWNDNLKLIDEEGYYTKKLIPTITTKQDRNPNSGVIYYNNNEDGKAKFRYLTPRECFLLMGFEEEDFDKIIDNNFKINKRGPFFTDAKLIKMAGNSIVVDILVEIFKLIDEINEILSINNSSIKKCV